MMFWTCVRSVFGADEQPLADVGRREALGERLRTCSSRGVSGSIGWRSADRSRAAATRWAMPRITERGQERLPGVRALRTGRHDVLDGAVLGQVAVGAGLDRLEDRLVVVDGGQHHDPRARPAGLDRAGRLGAGAVRQAVVHQDDVHPLARELLGLGDGGGDPDDLDIRLRGEDRASEPVRS